MDQSARPHIIRAISIIRSHANLILVPSIVIGISYLSFLFPEKFGGLLAFGSVLATLIIYPLMYGRFTEIINGEAPVSWGEILREHWWNFIAVSIVLHVPLFVWYLISYTSGVTGGALTYLLYGLINVVSIYVIPLVFLTRERLPCIPLGIKCLVGNFRFSSPLVFLSVLSIALSLSMGPSGADATLPPPSALGGLVVTFLMVAVDFVVFVAACLVLKEKLFHGEVQRSPQ
jgi:hypothetical protein